MFLCTEGSTAAHFQTLSYIQEGASTPWPFPASIPAAALRVELILWLGGCWQLWYSGPLAHTCSLLEGCSSHPMSSVSWGSALFPDTQPCFRAQPPPLSCSGSFVSPLACSPPSTPQAISKDTADPALGESTKQVLPISEPWHNTQTL